MRRDLRKAGFPECGMRFGVHPIYPIRRHRRAGGEVYDHITHYGMCVPLELTLGMSGRAVRLWTNRLAAACVNNDLSFEVAALNRAGRGLGIG